MKHWVKGTYFEVDTNVLAQIKQFAISIRGGGTMKRLAEELHSAATERVGFQCHCQRLISSHFCPYLADLCAIIPCQNFTKKRKTY